MPIEINNIRLEPADNNGFILSFEEINRETTNKDSACRYEYKKEVFTDEKSAISRMNALQGKKSTETEETA